MSAPPPLPVAQRGWFERNWKWCVPVLLAAAMALVAALFIGFFALVFGAMRSSDAYRLALEEARAHPQATSALGEPIEAGWFVSGNVQTSGPSGKAELQIPVSGPRGEGDIFLEADKSAGQWRFKTLVVQIDADGRRIDLLADPAGR